ncbi:MAG: hypothetical protein JO112_17585, partial [Planctomycetes bacterium]|nr:hypothetical protein [Planctomycetota bacterium]
MKHFLGKALSLLGLVLLYLAGMAHWMWFFNYGEMNFQVFDWPKEECYYHLLSQCLQTGTIPYHISETFHGTDRFLGLPETLLSPQIVLLPFLTEGRFFLVNLLLLYSAGFLGCLLLKIRYGLSWLPFAFLFVLFNFNGYITSHLAVGHTMWNGYFLLPFLGLFILEWVEEGRVLRPALKISLVLFLMLLQGSFHMVVWCGMFLAFLVLCHPPWIKQGLLILIFTGLLGLFRLLPAVIAFWHFQEYQFISGYPTVAELLNAFTTLRDYTYAWIGVQAGDPDRRAAWWEYDIYTGMLGLAWLVFFGIGCRFSRDPHLQRCRYPALDWPVLLLSLLSMTDVYEFIADLPLPLVRGERLSCRFLIIPVVMLLILAAIRFQRVLERTKPRWTVLGLLVVGLLQIASGLHTHAVLWRITRLEEGGQCDWPGLGDVEVVQRPDAFFQAAVNVSFFISLAALAGWGF